MSLGQFNPCGTCCGPAEITYCQPRTYSGQEYELRGIEFQYADPAGRTVIMTLRFYIVGAENWTIVARASFSSQKSVTQTFPTAGLANRTYWLIDPAKIDTSTYTVVSVAGNAANFAAAFGMTPQEFIDSVQITPNSMSADYPDTQRISSLAEQIRYRVNNEWVAQYDDTLLRGKYPFDAVYKPGVRIVRTFFAYPAPATLMVTIPDGSPFAGTYWLSGSPELTTIDFQCATKEHLNFLPVHQATLAYTGVEIVPGQDASELPYLNNWAAALDGASAPLQLFDWRLWGWPTTTAGTLATYRNVYFGRAASCEHLVRLEIEYNWITGVASKIRATIDSAHAAYAYTVFYEVMPAGSVVVLETPPGWTATPTTQDITVALSDGLGGFPEVTRKVIDDPAWWLSHANDLALVSVTPESKGFTLFSAALGGS